MRALLVLLIAWSAAPNSAFAEDRSLVRSSTRAAGEAPARVALVVANSRYENTASLPGTRHDADAIADALEEVGFEVWNLHDLDARDFDKAIVEFGVAARGAEVAAFYYSGHGLQVDGENYLVPTDAALEGPEYVRSQAVALADVLTAMDAAETQLNIVILDACRNNPFAKGWVSRNKAVPAAGLATVNAYSGFFIAYATAPGDTAIDGGDDVGPYARALSAELTTGGAELSEVFRKVGGAVTTATSGDQVPWTASAYFDRFYFVPPLEAGADPLVASAALPAPPTKTSWVLAGSGMAAAAGSAAAFLLVALPTHRYLLDQPTLADARAAQQLNHAAIVGGYALGLAAGGLTLGAVIQGKW